MEIKSSLPHLQKLATCPSPEPDQFNLWTHPNLGRFILLLFYHLCQGPPITYMCTILQNK